MARPRPKKAAPDATPHQASLVPSPTTRFERDVKRMKKRGEDMETFKAVIDAFCSREPLAPELREHPLKGNWKSWRDCHVGPDWIIIYRTTTTN